jgi:hypothetical protein
MSRRANGASLAAPVRLNLLISGVYAWAVTVMIPAFGTGVVPVLCAAAALVALVGGVLLSRRFPDVGRTVTMVGFLGFSCVTWLTMGDAINIAALEPVRSALGALGWLVFGLSWGSVRQPGTIPEDHPRFLRSAEPLLPRRALPRLTVPVFAIAVVCALSPWLVAWTVARREQALLAHSLGLGAALWLLVSGVDIAVAVGTRHVPRPPKARLNSVLVVLAWACALAAVGTLYWATEVRP